MSLCQSSASSGVSVLQTAPEVKEDFVLYSNTSSYAFLELISEGAFGHVAKCQNLATQETVAVKILKTGTDVIQDVKDELSILKMVSVLDPDHVNIVKFFEQFDYMGKTCLAFEMLDCSLYDLLEQRDWKPLPLHQIRSIATQLLTALDALKGLRILHTDIKPENIMLVNSKEQPFRVKLIDFGAAITVSEVQPEMMVQPIGYRAPEVVLGLPFNEAIDVWGVGCILSFLYLADNLFPVNCNYQMIKCMVEVLGRPEDHLLSDGMYTHQYFIKEEGTDRATWRLMSPDEYSAANSVQPEERHSYIDLPSSLDNLVDFHPEEEAALEDRMIFIDLLKGLLHLDGEQRTRPFQALHHSFIGMSELRKHYSSEEYPTTYEAAITNVHSMDPADSDYNSAASTAWCTDDGQLGDVVETWSFDDYICCDEGTNAVFSFGNVVTFLSSSPSESVGNHDGDISVTCGHDAAAGAAAAASASTGSKGKFLKRTREFVARVAIFCCSCLPKVKN